MGSIANINNYRYYLQFPLSYFMYFVLLLTECTQERSQGSAGGHVPPTILVNYNC